MFSCLGFFLRGVVMATEVVVVGKTHQRDDLIPPTLFFGKAHTLDIEQGYLEILTDSQR